MRRRIAALLLSVSLAGTVAAQTKPAAYRRSNQRTPTADRYREIQRLLIERGYLTGEATGVWGPASIDAVKRFQKDQKLTDDGKLGALTLTALGLGPKHPAVPVVAAKLPEPGAPIPLD